MTYIADKRQSALAAGSYRQMLEQPDDYWPFMFAEVDDAYKSCPHGHITQQAALTQAEKVVFISAMTAVFEITIHPHGSDGGQRLLSARRALELVGGWVALNGQSLPERPLKAERKDFRQEYTHVSDSFAWAIISANFDFSLPGLDTIHLSFGLGPQYKQEAVWLTDYAFKNGMFPSLKEADIVAPVNEGDDTDFSLVQSAHDHHGARDGWRRGVSFKVTKDGQYFTPESIDKPTAISLLANKEERSL